MAILTENLREGLYHEIDLQIHQLERNLDELIWRKKRLEAEGGQAQEALAQLEAERRKVLETRQRLGERRKDIARLELGVEILHSKAECEITVRVGDLWEDAVNPEIVLEDGRVVAIRGIRHDFEEV